MKILSCSAALVICLGALAACDNERAALVRVWGAAEAGQVEGAPEVARFSNPVNVETAPDGTVYVADYDNDAVRAISPDGIVSTLTQLTGFRQPFGLTLSDTGELFVSTDANDAGQKNDTSGTIWQIDRGTGVPTVVATSLGRPRGLQALPAGRIAISDLLHEVVEILDLATGTVTVIAGAADQPGYVDDTGALARFDRPYGLGVTSGGDLLVADQNNNVIRKVTLAGTVTTFAGTGVAGSANGALAAATFNAPEDVAVAGSAVYIAEPGNHLVRRIAGGFVTTEAGNGVAGFIDADGTSAEFFGLEGLALSRDGRFLWIADGNGGNGDPFNRVRRLPVTLP